MRALRIMWKRTRAARRPKTVVVGRACSRAAAACVASSSRCFAASSKDPAACAGPHHRQLRSSLDVGWPVRPYQRQYLPSQSIRVHVNIIGHARIKYVCSQISVMHGLQWPINSTRIVVSTCIMHGRFWPQNYLHRGNHTESVQHVKVQL